MERPFVNFFNKYFIKERGFKANRFFYDKLMWLANHRVDDNRFSFTFKGDFYCISFILDSIIVSKNFELLEKFDYLPVGKVEWKNYLASHNGYDYSPYNHISYSWTEPGCKNLLSDSHGTETIYFYPKGFIDLNGEPFLTMIDPFHDTESDRSYIYFFYGRRAFYQCPYFNSEGEKIDQRILITPYCSDSLKGRQLAGSYYEGIPPFLISLARNDKLVNPEIVTRFEEKYSVYPSYFGKIYGIELLCWDWYENKNFETNEIPHDLVLKEVVYNVI